MAMSIVPKTLCQLSMAITIPQKLSIPMVVNTIAHVWSTPPVVDAVATLSQCIYNGDFSVENGGKLSENGYNRLVFWQFG